MDGDVPLRPQLVDELLHRAGRDDFVRFALDDDARGRTWREEAEVVHVRRRRDRDEAPDLRTPHQKLHAYPRAEADACDPGCLRFRVDALHPIESARRVAELADSVVEYALALADPAEIEAERREATPDERLVEELDDLVVHRAPGLRVRMKDQGDRRARAASRMETSFEASLGAWENDFGHGFRARVNIKAASCAGARRRPVLYRGGG